MEKNGLQLGDTVIGKIWDPNYNNPEVEMELVGVFDLVADKEDEANMYDEFLPVGFYRICFLQQ